MLTIIMFQVRSFSATSMVMLTAPLGLIGAVPVLLLFHQPFGFNAILGLIGLAGILMRNTLILIGQIQTNPAARARSLPRRRRGHGPTRTARDPDGARRRASLHPLTQSVFWGSMAYTLIGGTAVGHRSDLGVPAGALRHLVPLSPKCAARARAQSGG